MKKIIQFSIALTLLLLSKVSAQPYFQWAQGVGSPTLEQGRSVTTDTQGNVYVVGVFQGTVDFDPGPSTFTMASAGFRDVYITKTSYTGILLWAKRIGGSGDEESRSITCDANGDLLITGNFQSTIDFDPDAGIAFLSANSFDVFVLKLTSSGSYSWAVNFGGNNYDIGNGIATDASNNVYITGNFLSVADFDPGVGTYTVSTAGSNDIFVVKLSSFGSFVWASTFGGTSSDRGISISVDASGNVYTTGEFHTTCDFDPGVGTYTINSLGSTDIFVSKLDNNGNFVWAYGFGNVNTDAGLAINATNAGSVVLTGRYSGTVDFDPGVGVSSFTSSGGSYDVFVLNLNAAGALNWIRCVGSGGEENGKSLSLDASGNVYFCGTYQSTTDFDPGAGVFNLTSSGSDDMFTCKYNSSGNFVWAVKTAAAGNDVANSLCLSNNNVIYLTGYFNNTVDFDPTPGTFTIASAGTDDAFLLRLSECVAPSVPANSTPSANLNICAGNSTTLSATASGTVSWFTTPSGIVSLGTGTNYSTPVLSQGTYTYYAENFSCINSATRTAVIVTVNVLPTQSVSSSGSVCLGSTATLNVGGASTYTWLPSGSSSSIVITPTATSVYTVSGTNSLTGCASTSTVTQFVNALPGLTVTGTPSICSGSSATLNATGTDTYSWSTGASVSSVVVTPTTTAIYSVTGTSSLTSCSKTNTIEVQVVICTGIQEENRTDSYSIYPNPTASSIHLRSPSKTHVKLYNALGQLLLTTTTEDETTEVDLSSFEDGIYILRIEFGSLSSSMKVIKH